MQFVQQAHHVDTPDVVDKSPSRVVGSEMALVDPNASGWTLMPTFASERIEATEAEAQHDDTKELLERGLTPKQIADLFYSSVYHCDMDTWLATLCDELKSNPSPAAPGGFAMTGWKEGRDKLRKYGTHYEYVDEAPLTDGSLELRYMPLYGKVPGYVPDSAIGDAVRICVFQEMGEWRVAQAQL